jgi:hypothetical protein
MFNQCLSALDQVCNGLRKVFRALDVAKVRKKRVAVDDGFTVVNNRRNRNEAQRPAAEPAAPSAGKIHQKIFPVRICRCQLESIIKHISKNYKAREGQLMVRNNDYCSILNNKNVAFNKPEFNTQHKTIKMIIILEHFVNRAPSNVESDLVKKANSIVLGVVDNRFSRNFAGKHIISDGDFTKERTAQFREIPN